jgi:tetratricopeptide (TPR) repeat protein
MSVRFTLGTFVLAGFLVSAIYVRQRDPPAPAAEGSPLDSLIASGEAHYWEGEFEEAESIWLNALDRSRETGNAKIEARVLTWLGLAAYRTGEYSDARRLGEEALASSSASPGWSLQSYNASAPGLNEGRLVEATTLPSGQFRAGRG